MYGGMWVFEEGKFDNEYYDVAKEKPSPITDEFTKDYFLSLIEDGAMQKKSIKAFLATEQRIPGLGNGVLQDILYNAKIFPKRKVETLSDDEKGNLYLAIKSTLSEMIKKGGRDTEKDLYGNQGGYKTKVSKLTVGKPCPFCGEIIEKKSYMGGSIYYCIGCQL
jgi:formamidopyrimidine-DNA glycosylase